MATSGSSQCDDVSQFAILRMRMKNLSSGRRECVVHKHGCYQTPFTGEFSGFLALVGHRVGVGDKLCVLVFGYGEGCPLAGDLPAGGSPRG